MKKCLVLDLDNTLWGGVVGEDGLENLALSLTAPGNSYLAFQQAILDHYDRGVILAINSRNNPEDAWAVIRSHPNMILKEKHFAAARMNWNDKAQNLKELAKELNIGLDSIVFLDDEPTNRSLVRALLPEVYTPDLPSDPGEYARFLNSLGVFEGQAVTAEDKMRGNLYVTERLRKEQEKTFSNKEEFLQSLGLELSLYQDSDSHLPRLAQMTEKTNQFNVFKNPLSEQQIASYIKSPNHKVFYGKLQDKFGDYGIVILAIVETDKNAWHISNYLMSCRVFGRSLEHAFLAALQEQALEQGATALSMNFQESEKNAPAQEFVNNYFIDHQNSASKKILKPTGISAPAWIKVKKV